MQPLFLDSGRLLICSPSYVDACSVYSIGSSVHSDNVAISPALKCPNRNTDTPTSLTFPGAVDNGLVDKRNNFTPLQERAVFLAVVPEGIELFLNISRAAASARALSLRLSSFSSSRNLFLRHAMPCLFEYFPSIFFMRLN